MHVFTRNVNIYPVTAREIVRMTCFMKLWKGGSIDTAPGTQPMISSIGVLPNLLRSLIWELKALPNVRFSR